MERDLCCIALSHVILNVSFLLKWKTAVGASVVVPLLPKTVSSRKKSGSTKKTWATQPANPLEPEFDTGRHLTK